jgi:holo-[acyl-carrier protein] synthase
VIYGIGVDLIEIERIRAAEHRFGDRFARRILGEREIERYELRRQRSETRGIAFLATRFAAKEAISKALGLGMRMPMSWRAVEIINDSSGRPIAVVSGDELRQYVTGLRLKLHVSLTDERGHAAAYAIAETEEGMGA